MSKQHRTAGVDYTLLTIAGQTFKLRPITLGDYAEMESHILATNFDHSKRRITDEQASQFENSRTGLKWMLWKCIKADHPEFDSLETVQKLVDSTNPVEYQQIVDVVRIASGSADMGKIIWPHLPAQASDSSDANYDPAHENNPDPGPGWPAIYLAFAEKYGWTPDQVNRLTFFQFAIYAGAITPEHRRVKVNPNMARTILQQHNATNV